MGEGILRFIKPDMIQHGLSRKCGEQSTMKSLMRKAVGCRQWLER
jgi:hypothetical protein